MCTVSLCGFVYWIPRLILWRKLDFKSKSCTWKHRKIIIYYLYHKIKCSQGQRTQNVLHSDTVKSKRTACGVFDKMNTDECLFFKKLLVIPLFDRPSLEKGSDQLIVTLHTISIYPFVNKQLIWTLFEAHFVPVGF